MRGRASELLLPVRLRGIRVGRASDLLLDADARTAVAIEVACGDDSIRLLPFAAARLEGDGIALDSPFLLIGDGERSFYRRRARGLKELRGATVLRDGAALGRLDDVELLDGGTVRSLVLAGGLRVEPGEGVRIVADGAAPAA